MQLSVTHPSYGVGWRPSALTVPLSVTSVSPSEGSLGGGLLVTLLASGFSTATPSDNSVVFGGVPCAVVSASATQLTCTTGAVSTGSTPLVLSASATQLTSAAAVAFPAVTFMYSTALTDTVVSINTTRGSTAGGTPLLITGSFSGAAGRVEGGRMWAGQKGQEGRCRAGQGGDE